MKMYCKVVFLVVLFVTLFYFYIVHVVFVITLALIKIINIQKKPHY